MGINMAYLKINSERIDAAAAEMLVSLCPFSAISRDGNNVTVNSGCKMCKLCVKKSGGLIEYVEDAPKKTVDKAQWRGIAVYADCSDSGKLHNVTLELLGKAKELAAVTGHPVYALLAGSETQQAASTLLQYGADKVFVYDYPQLKSFMIEPYANVFEDFVNKVKPSSILVGATNVGRSLAPRVAARFRTGLTADCTVLEMKENTDLVQIRPAFGGNIMARIVTPNTRPQFCTVRHKIFSVPEKQQATGEKVSMSIEPEKLQATAQLINIEEKPKQIDISDAEVIVAIGRGVKSPDDMAMINELAALLHAQVACTRPLVENGRFDAKQQIGLSGRTVKPKLIVAIGLSGAVQFAAGMKGSDCIVAINSDASASIFDTAHYGFVGDLYEIVPKLIEKLKARKPA